MAATSDADRAPLLAELFAPSESCSLEGTAETKNYLVLSVLEDVVTSFRFWKLSDGQFQLARTFEGEMGVAPSVSGVNAEDSDAIWLTSEGYARPTTLAIADAGAPDAAEPLKALPSFFDASGLATQQLYAASADGTVPGFYYGEIPGNPGHRNSKLESQLSRALRVRA